MAEKQVVNNGGVGVLGLLGVTLIVLKLCGIIDWSWVWVLAPFWVLPAIVITVGLFALLVIVAVKAYESKRRSRNRSM